MEHRIHAAALDCVDNCLNWNNPLVEIQAYSHVLVVDLGWSQADAVEVAQRALKIIDPAHPLLTKVRGGSLPERRSAEVSQPIPATAL